MLMISRRHLLGISLILLAFFFSSILSAIGKVVMQTVPIGIVLFSQNLVALLLLVPFILMRQITTLRTNRLPLHLFRAITGLLSYACFFIAIKYISLINANLLGNSAPLFLPLVAIFWVKEKVSLTVWASLILGFIGVFFILNPSEGLLKNSMDFIALLASLFSAIALQAVRNLKQTEPVLSILFYYFFIASLFTLPLMIIQWIPLNQTQWLLLIAMGFLLGWIQLAIAQAYQYASPTLLGPFNYSVIVFSGLIQWQFWGVVPDSWGWIGIALVTLGGILTVVQQKPSEPK